MVSSILFIMVLVMGSASTNESPDEVGELRDQLLQLNNRMTQQEEKMVQHEQTILEQQQMNVEQEQQLTKQVQNNAELKQKLADQQQEISELKKLHEAGAAQAIIKHTGGSPYAGVDGFSAHLPTGVFSEAGIIAFSEVDYVQGSGYDQMTGVYTAPVDGYYLFHGSLVEYSTVQAYVYLMINGVYKQQLYLATSYGYIAATLGGVFKLSVGDTVNLELGGGGQLYSYYDTCHFDGFLLFEII